MSDAKARLLVAALVSVTIALEVAAVALAVGVASMGEPVLYAVNAIVQVVAGAVIVWTYPRHRIGWLLTVLALGSAVFADVAASYGQRGHVEGWPGAAYAEIVSLTAWIVAALGMNLLFLLFPNGRYLSPGWRWVPVMWLVGATLAIPGWALNPRLGGDLAGGVNPLATDALPVEPLYVVGAGLVSASLVASVIVLLVRFTRSRDLVRQQLKWVMLAGAVLALVLPLSAALWTAWPPVQYLAALALPLLPLAVCVAIIRQNLYDIDLVVSRTVAYGALTGVVGVIYAAVVVSVGAFVASPVAAAAGALVVAVTFWPLRRRIQDVVDQRFRRARHESRRVMTDFVDRLRRGDAGANAVEEALRTAVHDPALALAFRSTGTTYDVHGRPRDLLPKEGRRITPLDTGQNVVTLIWHRDTDDRLDGRPC